jgi:hypothetical protein
MKVAPAFKANLSWRDPEKSWKWHGGPKAGKNASAIQQAKARRREGNKATILCDPCVFAPLRETVYSRNEGCSQDVIEKKGAEKRHNVLCQDVYEIK